MSFVAILFALLLEQARPLGQVNLVHNTNRTWVYWVVRNFDAGKPWHGGLTWSLAVLLPSLLAFCLHWFLVWTLGWVAAVIWNIAVLYATLGFRQFSHHFTRIRDALYAGDEALARQGLAEWMRMDASELPRSEIVRHVIEYSAVSAHRHVFGVLTWYCVATAVGLGPAGAVFYRTAEYVGRLVDRPLQPTHAPLSAAFQASANRAWYLADWVPVRLTALGFAFVGSFEEAIDSWRQYAVAHPEDNDGIILAATAGAIDVKLGTPQLAGDQQVPQTTHLRAFVGLVWRTVVMWMVILVLLSLARLLG
ncbi:MAG: cobalamin biosynthesis protein [Rhodoferax sp.]|nr:cobalamin biosynthesis protein [Rhodoferax sp.]